MREEVDSEKPYLQLFNVDLNGKMCPHLGFFLTLK